MHESDLHISKYVAIGDSISAGYNDGALYYAGQITSFPNLLAYQLSMLQTVTFKQPLLEENSPGIGFFGNSRMIAKRKKDTGKHNTLVLSYLAEHGDLQAFQTNFYHTNGPYHNLGVPGAKAITALMAGFGNPANGEGNYNPYFTRMCSDPATASILSDALILKPDFFTFFLGSNDILAYALSGGTQDVLTPPFGKEPHCFEYAVNTAINSLIQNGAKGVVISVPDIITIPYFITIPYNGLHLSATEAEKLNKTYKNTTLKSGANPFILETKDGTRLMEHGEMILLDMLIDPEAGTFISGNKPIPKKYYLTHEQIDSIRNHIRDYNTILRGVAKKHGLSFVNTQDLLGKLKQDREFDGVCKCLHYKNTRVFSLDGIHLSPLGQALLANEVIRQIGKTYHLSIPKIVLAKYRRKPYTE